MPQHYTRTSVVIYESCNLWMELILTCEDDRSLILHPHIRECRRKSIETNTEVRKEVNSYAEREKLDTKKTIRDRKVSQIIVSGWYQRYWEYSQMILIM